jgi:hypothetical protein
MDARLVRLKPAHEKFIRSQSNISFDDGLRKILDTCMGSDYIKLKMAERRERDALAKAQMAARRRAVKPETIAKRRQTRLARDTKAKFYCVGSVIVKAPENK